MTHETKSNLAYWNGKFVSQSEIRLDPVDLGVLRGYGVFDAMRTENGKPFLIERHWARLGRSAETLRLSLPVDFETFQKIVRELLDKNALPAATIRTVLTGGPSDDGFLPTPGRETFYILIAPFTPMDAACYEQGITVVTLDHARTFPHAKVINYVAAIRHAPERVAANATEVVYTQNGHALEASTSNLMIVKDGRVITPQQDVLQGITRGLTLELAKEHGIPFEERPVTLEELLAADEMFLTGSYKLIVPVVRVNEQTIGAGVPGPVTKTLMTAMHEYTTKY